MLCLQEQCECESSKRVRIFEKVRAPGLIRSLYAHTLSASDTARYTHANRLQRPRRSRRACGGFKMDAQCTHRQRRERCAMKAQARRSSAIRAACALVSLSAVVARRRGAYRDSSPSPSPVAFAEGSRGGRSCAIPSTSQPTLRASSCDTLYTNIWSDTLSVIADGGRCRPPATSHLWRREKVRPLCFEVGPCKVRDRQ